jgi:hypothetical protein
MTNKVTNTTALVAERPIVGLATAALPGGIEASERAGQRELVASQVLPTAIHRLYPDGDARALLVQWGFIFGEPVEGDPIFQHATLPPGWSKKGTDHDMWSKILDEHGRERCAIFYKAAFYDRSAHMSVSARYQRSREYQDEKKRFDGPTRGVVKEGDVVLFVGPWRDATEADKYAGFERAGKDADDWFKANLPSDIAEQWAR